MHFRACCVNQQLTKIAGKRFDRLLFQARFGDGKQNVYLRVRRESKVKKCNGRLDF